MPSEEGGHEKFLDAFTFCYSNNPCLLLITLFLPGKFAGPVIQFIRHHSAFILGATCIHL